MNITSNFYPCTPLPATMKTHGKGESPEAAARRVQDEYDFFTALSHRDGGSETELWGQTVVRHQTQKGFAHPIDPAAVDPLQHVLALTEVEIVAEDDRGGHDHVSRVEYKQMDDGSLQKTIHDYGQRPGRDEEVYQRPDPARAGDPVYQQQLMARAGAEREGNVQVVESVNGFQYTVVHCPRDYSVVTAGILDEMFIARQSHFPRSSK